MKLWPWGPKNHMTGFRASWNHIFQIVYFEMIGEEGYELVVPNDYIRRKFIIKAHWFTFKSMIEFWWEEFWRV